MEALPHEENLELEILIPKSTTLQLMVAQLFTLQDTNCVNEKGSSSCYYPCPSKKGLLILLPPLYFDAIVKYFGIKSIFTLEYTVTPTVL